jgi:hypothetical protein
MKGPTITFPSSVLSLDDDTECSEQCTYNSTLADLWSQISDEDLERWEDGECVEIWTERFGEIAHYTASFYETRLELWLLKALDCCLELNLPIPKTLENARTLAVETNRTVRDKRNSMKDAMFFEMASLVTAGVSVETASEITARSARLFFKSHARLSASTLEKQFPQWREKSNIVVQLEQWFNELTEEMRENYRSKCLNRAELAASNPLPSNIKGNRRGDR